MEADHPTLTPAEVRDFIDKVVRHGDVTNEAVRGFLIRLEIQETKTAKRIDAVVDGIMSDVGADLGKALEPVEARHCGAVFEVLDELPDRALGDPQFWSFLAIRHFWRFVAVRQYSAWLAVQGEPRDPDEPESERQKLERYLIGKDHYQIPLRMYLRAQAVGIGDDFGLTEIPGGGTDFWRSQILGVRTSQYPAVARTVVRAQSEMNLDIEQQRPPGRRVNRLRANIEFFHYDDQEAKPIIDDLWRVTTDDKLAATAKKARKATRKATAKKVPAKKSPAPEAEPPRDR